MSTSGAHRLALIIRNSARSGAKYHAPSGMTVGVVRTPVPALTIQPLTSTVALPDEALGWTDTSEILKTGLNIDDLVLLAMVAGQYYVIDKVAG